MEQGALTPQNNIKYNVMLSFKKGQLCCNNIHFLPTAHQFIFYIQLI